MELMTVRHIWILKNHTKLFIQITRRAMVSVPVSFASFSLAMQRNFSTSCASQSPNRKPHTLVKVAIALLFPQRLTVYNFHKHGWLHASPDVEPHLVPFLQSACRCHTGLSTNGRDLHGTPKLIPVGHGHCHPLRRP